MLLCFRSQQSNETRTYEVSAHRDKNKHTLSSTDLRQQKDYFDAKTSELCKHRGSLLRLVDNFLIIPEHPSISHFPFSYFSSHIKSWRNFLPFSEFQSFKASFNDKKYEQKIFGFQFLRDFEAYALHF